MDISTVSLATIDGDTESPTVGVLEQQQLQQNHNEDPLHESEQTLVELSEQMNNITEIQEGIVSIPKEVILISMVSQEQALYNPKHELYRNTVQKDQKWVQIADSVGWSETQCKGKWKALRDQYCRELKRSKFGSKANIKWKYFKELDFLRPFALSRNYRPRNLLQLSSTDAGQYANVKNEAASYSPCEYPSTEIKIENQLTTQTGHLNEMHQHQMHQDNSNNWSYVTSNSNNNNNDTHQQTSADDVLTSFVQQIAQNGNGIPMEHSNGITHIQQQQQLQHQQQQHQQQQQQQQTEEEDDDPIHTFLNIESYFEKELISMIQLEDILYNSLHPSYRNVKMKLEVWAEIARRLKKTVKQCRLKWKALRDQYIREHKRLKSRQNADSLPRWKHYDALSFLQKFIRHKSIENTNLMTLTKAEIDVDLDDHMTSSSPSPAPGQTHSISPQQLNDGVTAASVSDHNQQQQHQLQQQQQLHETPNVGSDCDEGMDISNYIIDDEDEDHSSQRFPEFHHHPVDEDLHESTCTSKEKCSNQDSSQSMQQHVEESHGFSESQSQHHHQQQDLHIMAAAAAVTATTSVVATPTNEDSAAAFSLAANFAEDDEVGAFFRAVAMKIRNAKMSPVAFTDLQIDILRVINGALRNH